MGLRLVLGGARSGKSAYAQGAAEACARGRGAGLVFVATAEGRDEEMRARIARHQADRGSDWRLVETPLDLSGALAAAGPDEVVLVDCLTLWLSNSMLLEDGDGHVRRTEALLAALAAVRGEVWLVSNEVGWGVAPDNALARRYRDEAGRLHQRIAALADEVALVVAGLPLILRGRP